MKTLFKTITWSFKKNKLEDMLYNYCKLEYNSFEVDSKVAEMMRVSKNAHFA